MPDAIERSASNVRIDEVMEGRVADLVVAIESPGSDERCDSHVTSSSVTASPWAQRLATRRGGI
jgi:hypothetical protein